MASTPSEEKKFQSASRLRDRRTRASQASAPLPAVNSTDSTKTRAAFDCDVNVNLMVMKHSAFGTEQTEMALGTRTTPPPHSPKPGAPAETYTLRRARTQLGPRQIFHRKVPGSRRFLLISCPISYIMLTRKWDRIHAHPTSPCRRLFSLLPLSYFLSAVFADFSCASS
jgi:hypothetical protein